VLHVRRAGSRRRRRRRRRRQPSTQKSAEIPRRTDIFARFNKRWKVEKNPFE